MKKQRLESLYETYNTRDYVHPDPLEFLYRYPQIKDREIAGMIASSLAFGRVHQILDAVSRVLDVLGESPSAYLSESSHQTLQNDFRGFVYRFVKGENIAGLLAGLKGINDGFGTIGNCFVEGVSQNDETLVSAMSLFTRHLTKNGHNPGYLVAHPEKGSACKRMNLFLRWMIREDCVDPGGWESIPSSKLVVPLDTHMHKIGLKLGLTSRRQADMKTAIEITDGFRTISPDDPVKYDFALTRFGIRDDMTIDDL